MHFLGYTGTKGKAARQHLPWLQLTGPGGSWGTGPTFFKSFRTCACVYPCELGGVPNISPLEGGREGEKAINAWFEFCCIREVVRNGVGSSLSREVAACLRLQARDSEVGCLWGDSLDAAAGTLLRPCECL